MSQNTLAIQELYVAYFNRPADPAGLAYWETVVAANNGDTSAVSATFSQSPEYQAAFKGMSNDQIVNQVYNNLFGHDADVGGLIYWSNLLSAGKITVSNVVTQIAGGALTTDKDALTDKVSIADQFTTALDTTSERLAYTGAAANAAAATFLSTVKDADSLKTAEANLDATIANIVNNAPVANQELTSGIDHLTGTAGNDAFTAIVTSATVSELNPLDSIDGGGGVNSFTIASTPAIGNLPAGFTMTNIQTLNLISSSTINTNAAGFAGLTAVNLTAGGAASLTASATADVNDLAATNSVTITGGKNVVVNASTTGQLISVQHAAGDVTVTNVGGGNVNVGNATAIGGAITVTSDGAINAGGGTSLTTTASDAVAYATQLADIAAAAVTAKAYLAAQTAQSAAHDTVSNLGDLTTDLTGVTDPALFTSITASYLSSHEITAAQKLSLDTAFLSASTSGQAAAVAAVLNPLVTAANAAAAAADLVVASANAANNTANTTVGDDSSVGNGSVTDTVNTKLASVSVTGNYNGSTIINDGSTLKDQLKTVSITNGSIAGGSGVISLTGNALANLSLADGAYGDVSITNTTIGNTLALTLSNVTAGNITDTQHLTAAVTIDAEGTTDLVQLSGYDAVASVVVSGVADVTLAGTSGGVIGTATATIDSTALTGAFTSIIGAGQTFTGGDGVNTIYTGSVAQTATVTAGAGASDTLVITSANNDTTAAAGKFVGFEVLEVTSGVSVDVSKFSKSTITSIVSDGAAALTGLTAAQAGAITVTAAGALTLGVTGATTVGQLDTVGLTIDNGGLASTSFIIADLAIAGVETLNVTTDTGVNIGSVAGSNALTSVTASGAGEFVLHFDLATPNVNTIIDAHAVTNYVEIDTITTGTVGLKIIGSDTADSQIIGNNGVSVLSAGDGNNNIHGGTAADTITSGNGNNIIVAGAGANVITVGNGYNTITAGAGVDHVTVGTGGNFISTGAGADVITLGAHALGTVDTIDLGNAATASLISDAATAGSAMYTISGFVSGADHLQIDAGTFQLTPAVGGGTPVPATFLLAGSTFATLGTAITDASVASVANAAAVYAALATDLTSANFLASASGAGNVHATEVTFGTGAAAGTYLVINDGQAGFQAGSDIVVKLVGNTTIGVHDLTVVAV